MWVKFKVTRYLWYMTDLSLSPLYNNLEGNVSGIYFGFNLSSLLCDALQKMKNLHWIIRFKQKDQTFKKIFLVQILSHPMQCNHREHKSNSRERWCSTNNVSFPVLYHYNIVAGIQCTFQPHRYPASYSGVRFFVTIALTINYFINGWVYFSL